MAMDTNMDRNDDQTIVLREPINCNDWHEMHNERTSHHPTHQSAQRWALDLFSGTGSVRRALEQLGFTVISVDWDPKWHADIVEDIRRWRYWEVYQPGHFQVIAASPPCTEYSTALTTRKRHLRYADSVAMATVELVRYLAPAKWWIENPRYGLL